MGSPLYPVTAADVTQDKIFPASIRTVQIKGSSETASQWSESLGEVVDGKLNAEAISIKLSGRRNISKAFEIKGEITLLVTGTAMQTALLKIPANATDIKLTDFSGNVFSFTSSQVSIQLSHKAEGDLDAANVFMLTLTGSITPTEFATCYTMSA